MAETKTKAKTEAPAAKKPKAKKKKKLTDVNGIAHIHATVNNTIITFTDLQGNTIATCSCGKVGYKGSKKSTPYAAGVAAENATKQVMLLGLKNVIVKVNGTGQGKDTAMRQIAASGLNITQLEDVTPIPHNGCTPPKKPR